MGVAAVDRKERPGPLTASAEPDNNLDAVTSVSGNQRPFDPCERRLGARPGQTGTWLAPASSETHSGPVPRSDRKPAGLAKASSEETVTKRILAATAFPNVEDRVATNRRRPQKSAIGLVHNRFAGRLSSIRAVGIFYRPDGWIPGGMYGGIQHGWTDVGSFDDRVRSPIITHGRDDRRPPAAFISHNFFTGF
jgi:hypothetical protein